MSGSKYLFKSDNGHSIQRERHLPSLEIHLDLPNPARRSQYQCAILEGLASSIVARNDVQMTEKTEFNFLSQCCPALMLTGMLLCSYSLIAVCVVDRFGMNELGPASLAGVTAHIAGFCAYESMVASLDIFTSETHESNKQHHLDSHIQRVSVMLLVVSMPVGAIWFCSPWFIVSLVPENELVLISRQYMHFYALGADAWGVFQATKRLNTAQGDLSASMWVALAWTPIHIILSWWMAFELHMGIWGASLALALIYGLQPVVFVLYIVLTAFPTLNCWSEIRCKRACHSWGSIISLSVPGVITTLSERLAFEILIFHESFLGTAGFAT